MNQGKLDMVKQEMESMNLKILGIIELKWTRTGEFNSDNHYIYMCVCVCVCVYSIYSTTVGKNPLEEMQ